MPDSLGTRTPIPIPTPVPPPPLDRISHRFRNPQPELYKKVIGTKTGACRRFVERHDALGPAQRQRGAQQGWGLRGWHPSHRMPSAADVTGNTHGLTASEFYKQIPTPTVRSGTNCVM